MRITIHRKLLELSSGPDCTPNASATEHATACGCPRQDTAPVDKLQTTKSCRSPASGVYTWWIDLVPRRLVSIKTSQLIVGCRITAFAHRQRTAGRVFREFSGVRLNKLSRRVECNSTGSASRYQISHRSSQFTM